MGIDAEPQPESNKSNAESLKKQAVSENITKRAKVTSSMTNLVILIFCHVQSYLKESLLSNPSSKATMINLEWSLLENKEFAQST